MNPTFMLVLQMFTVTAWVITVAYVFRQSRQLVALRDELDGYIQAHDRTAEEYRRTVDQLLDCSRGVNKALHEQDSRLRLLSSRHEQMQLDSGSGSSRYREAIDLLRRGADEDELVGACGLSRGEAHLIAHMERLQNRVVA
jgi:hypothetical protein